MPKNEYAAAAVIVVAALVAVWGVNHFMNNLLVKAPK